MKARNSPAASALIHPERMRIMAEIAGRDRMTAGELGVLLPEIRPASLYRHLGMLCASGFLEVVETRRRRGSVEKVYAFRQPGVGALPASAVRTDRELLSQLFMGFVMMMLGDMTRYARGKHFGDAAADPMFRAWPAYATDEEFNQDKSALEKIMERAYERGRSPARARRMFYAAAVPHVNGAE